MRAIVQVALRLVLTYAVVEIVYGNAQRYLVYILIFSTLTDVDRIPRVLKRDRQPAHGEPAGHWRSRFHELYGLILFSVGLSLCSLCVDTVLLQIIALSMILHYAADLLLCSTRPLYPFSDREVYLRNDLSGRDRDALSQVHKKTRLVRRVRAVVDYLFLRLPLPKVNPNVLSGLSIITSLLFVLTLRVSSTVALSFIIITLLLDWFDGLIAKKHNLCSEEGYIVDLVSDRVSEGIMFTPFFVPWFFLFVINSILAVVSFIKRKHIVLPLRHAFLITFVFFEF